MLREKLRAYEYYRDVVGVTLEQDRVVINIDFMQLRAEFGE